MRVATVALLAFVGLVVPPTCAQEAAPRFEVQGQSWAKNGAPERLISAGFHYFRTLPEQWDHRFRMIKAAGFNCVASYVPWNVHQPTDQGDLVFDGYANLPMWLELAQKHGMYVIMRPPPYICAEWEYGGIPAWVNNEDKYPNVEIRRDNDEFLMLTQQFMAKFLPVLKKYFYKNGGPVVLMQVENEYGSYREDKPYLRRLRDMFIDILQPGATWKTFNEVVLFQTDGASTFLVNRTAIDGVMGSVDFGPATDPYSHFMTARHGGANFGPWMNSELYSGWLSHWNEPGFPIRRAKAVAAGIDAQLSYGATISVFMTLGGTNFAWYAGANTAGTMFEPDVTSYDYTAVLTESGDATSTFHAIRAVLPKYRPGFKMPEVPADEPKQAFGRVAFTQQAYWRDNLAVLTTASKTAPRPIGFARLGTDYGFVYYSHKVLASELASGGRGGVNKTLKLDKVHDYAHVWVAGKFVGRLKREQFHEPDQFTLSVSAKAGDLIEVWLENQGRVNYGGLMGHSGDLKGLVGETTLDDVALEGWTSSATPLDHAQLSNVAWKGVEPAQKRPGTFYRATFNIAEEKPGSTFMEYSQFEKGVAWVNGFNIGRLWNAGPQYTLYVPYPLLRKGENELIVLSQEPLIGEAWVELRNEPDLRRPPDEPLDGDSDEWCGTPEAELWRKKHRIGKQ